MVRLFDRILNVLRMPLIILSQRRLRAVRDYAGLSITFMFFFAKILITRCRLDKGVSYSCRKRLSI